MLKRLWPEERGENLSEYAFLLLLMSFVAVAGVRGLASRLDNAYLKASSHFVAAGSMETITTEPIGNLNPNQTTSTVGPKGAGSGAR